MKKGCVLFTLIITSLLIGGCATVMEVNNNRLISSRNPYLEMKVIPDFKYLTHIKFEDQRASVDKTRNLRIKIDTFIFIPNQITKGIIPRYVYARLEENKDTRFVQPYLTGSNNFDREYIKLGWYLYEEVLNVSFPKIAGDIVLQKLIEEQYGMPECIIRKTAARVINDRKQAISLGYGEDATMSGFSCEQWKDRTKFTDEQKKYLTEFRKRASTVFEVIASD